MNCSVVFQIGWSLRPQRPSSPPLRGFFRDLVPRPLQNPLRFYASGRFDLRSRSGAGASNVPSGVQRGRAVPPSAQTLRSLRCVRIGQPTRLHSAAFRPPLSSLVPRCVRSGRSLASLRRIDLPRVLRSLRFRGCAPVGVLRFARFYADRPTCPSTPAAIWRSAASSWRSLPVRLIGPLSSASGQPVPPLPLPCPPSRRYAQATCVCSRSGPDCPPARPSRAPTNLPVHARRHLALRKLRRQLLAFAPGQIDRRASFQR